jgi:hypothetical protein
MIANPPPAENMETLTPLPDLHSPAPVLGAPPALRLPPPLPRPPRPSVAAMDAVSDLTVIDLHAQLKASTDAQTTVPGRPGPMSPRTTPAPTRPVSSSESKKG